MDPRVRAALLALLVLGPLAAGCVGAPAPGADVEPAPGGEPVALLDPVALDAGEVAERNPTNATLVWRGEAPLNGETFAIVSLPASALGVTVRLSWASTHGLRAILADRDGDPFCSAGAATAATRNGPLGDARSCTRLRVPSTTAQRAWTLTVSSDAPGQGMVPFEVTMFVEAFADAGPGRLGRVEPFEAQAADGVALRGTVYVPRGAGPFSTILLYSPYWDSPSPATDAYASRIDGEDTLAPVLGIDALLEAGYAVALVSLRGTGFSDGCYQYMNHPQNGPDANAVIDALAALPWSDGQIGMHGISYLGATQYDAVAFGPSPHLKAVVPVSGEWDEWNMLGSYGAAGLGATFHPGHRNRQQGLGVTLPPYGGPGISTLRPQHWCPETREPEDAHLKFVADGDKTGWFAERDLGDKLAGKEVPFFATFGMDTGEGHILQSNGLWDVLPQPRRLMLGPWDHAPPTDDWEWFTRTHAIPWFDHFMREGPAVPTDRVDYQDDEGEWRVASSWPPQGAGVALRLAPGALVMANQTAAEGQARLVNSDANDLSPDGCGTQDRAVFVSPPLAERVVLAGNFGLGLTLTSTAPNGNIAASLWAGEVEASCTLAERVSAKYVASAVSDLRHRGHLEIGTDFPVGTPTPVELISSSHAIVVPAGARLILVVGAGALGFAPKPFQPIVTIEMTPTSSAELAVNVVDGTLRFEDAPSAAARARAPLVALG